MFVPRVTFMHRIVLFLRIPVAARSKAWVCGRSLAGILGSNPAGAWTSVSCDCCVLSGRGPCGGLITRPEDSYRLWCAWVWSWSLDNEEALAHWGLSRCAMEKKWSYSYKQCVGVINICVTVYWVLGSSVTVYWVLGSSVTVYWVLGSSVTVYWVLGSSVTVYWVLGSSVTVYWVLGSSVSHLSPKIPYFICSEGSKLCSQKPNFGSVSSS
jgi:hypothetical protein